jgi:rSAM/selenodomain-associated transferase 1
MESRQLSTVALAITCKTPMSGSSKTRLSPPLRPDECAAISACFIRDLSSTISAVAADGGVTGYALYTPLGSEGALTRLLPEGTQLMPQVEGNFGERLLSGVADLIAAGHSGAILINSDSPTLPKAILREAVDAVRARDCVVLSPAFDGGYTLVGLSKPHARLFADIPWSTGDVYRLTLDRAREIGLPVVNVPGWYDIDDAESLRMLEAELAGERPRFAEMAGAEAPATGRFMRERRAAIAL